MNRLDKAKYPEVFKYLDLLRESGEVNMFGASQYVAREFEIPEREARGIVADWMRSFSHDS